MAQLVKNSPAMSRRHRRWGFNPWVGTIPRRRKWQLTPVFLPEKSHGQRSLAGCNAGVMRVVTTKWESYILILLKRFGLNYTTFGISSSDPMT